MIIIILRTTMTATTKLKTVIITMTTKVITEAWRKMTGGMAPHDFCKAPVRKRSLNPKTLRGLLRFGFKRVLGCGTKGYGVRVLRQTASGFTVVGGWAVRNSYASTLHSKPRTLNPKPRGPNFI